MQPWVATQARQSVCRLVWLQEEEVGRPAVWPHLVIKETLQEGRRERDGAHQSRAASRRLAGVTMLVSCVSSSQHRAAATCPDCHHRSLHQTVLYTLYTRSLSEGFLI